MGSCIFQGKEASEIDLGAASMMKQYIAQRQPSMEKINATRRVILLGEQKSGSSGGQDNGGTSKHNSRDLRGWVGPWAMICLCFEVPPLSRPPELPDLCSPGRVFLRVAFIFPSRASCWKKSEVKTWFHAGWRSYVQGDRGARKTRILQGGQWGWTINF